MPTDSAIDGVSGNGVAFSSLDAMRAKHASLLQASPTGEIDSELRGQVLDFLNRGAATGAMLDDPTDRRLAQGLLDYWKATLYTQRREDTSTATPELPKSLLLGFSEESAKRIAEAGSSALAGMTDSDREAARRVLLRLVQLEPTGREFRPVAVPRATLEAAGDPASIGRAVAALVSAGVLRVETGSTSAEDQISLRYESLIRTWKQLREWLKDRLRLREAAEFWHQTGRKREALVTGELLDEALRYRDLGPLEKDFADASHDEAERLKQLVEAARRREQELTRKEIEARQQATEAKLRTTEAREQEAAAKLRESEANRLREHQWRRALRVGLILCLALIAALGLFADQGRKALREEKLRTDDLATLNKALDEKVKAYEARDAAQRIAAEETKKRKEAESQVDGLKEEVKTSRVIADEATRTSFLISQEPPKPMGWKLWRQGETLRVRFLNGDRGVQKQVMEIAAGWSKSAPGGVLFKQSEDQDSEIRISLRPGGGNSSFIGTDALAVPVSHPTMFLEPNSARETILRNFGFALGLITETNNPNCMIEWDEEKTYAHYTRPPFNWSRARVRALILRRYSATELPWYRPFDNKSVMAFPAPASLMIAPANQMPEPVPENKDLSVFDKRFIRALYPPPSLNNKIAISPKREDRNGNCQTFRAFDRYHFTLLERSRVAFAVE
ncbi:MAG: hypothetical protein L0241_13770, partial [Planctomycetia bacterium]|nr:hypothetical protein [Planctomycetia bacterium]